VTRPQSLLLVAALLTVGVAAAVLRGNAAGSAHPDQVAPAGTSAAELTLIAKAQSALNEGNPAGARSALREHATRFPNGRLKVQRKLLEAYTDRVEKAAP
jgi:outer membrane protein assembly factor BamD (BamD/ComL family)